MSLLIAALAGVLPLLIAPGLLFHYDIIPRIAALALIAAIALVRSRDIGGELSALWNRRSGRWLCVIAGGQIMWGAVNLTISPRPWVSLLGTTWRGMGALTILALVVCSLLVAANLCEKPAGITTILRATALAAILSSLYGIAQYFDLDPLQTASAYQAHAGDSVIVRPPGTMGHADYFGWWLAIALFSSAGLAATATGAWRLIGSVAATLSGIAILFTGTRSAMLAVLAGVVVFGLSAGFKVRRSLVAVGLLLAVGLTAFYFSSAGTRMRARVQWSASEPMGGARPLLWRDSLRMFVDRPVTGFGLESFGAEFPRYQSTDLERLLPSFYQESPHNTAIDALVSEGVPGLVLAFGWIAVGVYAGVRAKRSDSALAPALTSALIASTVAAMFSAANCGPMIATALVLAMLTALTSQDSAPRLKIRSATILRISAPVAACLVGYAVALLTSDLALAKFARTPDPATYRDVVRMELPGAAEDLYCSRRLAETCGAETECAAAMMNAAARATITADNPSNAWYNLAILAATRNDPVLVEHALREASFLAPNWFKPHWTLATLLALTGHRQEARTEAKVAAFLDANHDAEVVQTVRELSANAQ